MNCLKCGTLNNQGAKFCVTCGQPLEVQSQATSISDGQSSIGEKQVAYQQPVYNSQSNVTQTVGTTFDFFPYILAVCIKPVQTIKGEMEKLKETKNSVLLTVIVSIVMVILSLLKTMFETVRQKTFSWSEGGYVTEWNFENLKNLDYVSLLVKPFLIFMVLVFAVALIYFLAGLILKKNMNYMKVVGIVISSLIPTVLAFTILSPILSFIYAPLAILIMIAGICYSLLILVMMMNDYLQFTNVDHAIYFHLSIVVVLVILLYFVVMNMLGDFVSSNLFDMLG